jgi:lysozyme family protein
MNHSYAMLAPHYDKLWAALVPSPAHLPELNKICDGLRAHQATYQEAATAVWGKPDHWWYVAVTDQMEGGGGAHTYLGNGQSLDRVTTEVPAGRGPFPNFVAGCVDALKGVSEPTSVSQAAYNWEAYNGWGYLTKPIEDPYLASFSNMYTKGKYVADHEYDPEAVSGQPGALTILKVLAPPELAMGPHDPLPPQKLHPTPTEPSPMQTTTGGHVVVDLTQIEAEVNTGLDIAEKMLPWLSMLLGPQVTALISAAIKGARVIETAVDGTTTSAAVAAATSHNTPGAPNAPALSLEGAAAEA